MVTGVEARAAATGDGPLTTKFLALSLLGLRELRSSEDSGLAPTIATKGGGCIGVAAAGPVAAYLHMKDGAGAATARGGGGPKGHGGGHEEAAGAAAAAAPAAASFARRSRTSASTTATCIAWARVSGNTSSKETRWGSGVAWSADSTVGTCIHASFLPVPAA